MYDIPLRTAVVHEQQYHMMYDIHFFFIVSPLPLPPSTPSYHLNHHLIISHTPQPPPRLLTPVSFLSQLPLIHSSGYSTTRSQPSPDPLSLLR